MPQSAVNQSFQPVELFVEYDLLQRLRSTTHGTKAEIPYAHYGALAQTFYLKSIIELSTETWPRRC